MTKRIVAVDLGATSGRVILATCDEDRITGQEEISRFPNNILNVGGKFYWNIWSIYEHIISALKKLASEKVKVDSIGIDTWGVDFVTVGKDGVIAGLPRSYRDPYTDGMPEWFYKNRMKKEDLYFSTGIQIMNFNTLFQFCAQCETKVQSLCMADKILFLPDALSYLLTGKMVCEDTILSTAQIVNAKTGEIDGSLLASAGVTVDMFPKRVSPGTVIGCLSDYICKETCINPAPVIAVAGHDTASAVAAIPSPDENFAYISSGTWSLIGIESSSPIINADTYKYNYTNEGGVDGTTRFLKNITGMWILEQCMKKWRDSGREYSYQDIAVLAAKAEPLKFFIDPDDGVFAHPENMIQAITDYCSSHSGSMPKSDEEFVRCIIDSLAMKYRYAISFLRQCAPFSIDRLYIIGGGSGNALLNQSTANATGLEVVAGPMEATAIGNIAMQLRALGVIEDRLRMREYIGQSVETVSYMPEDAGLWARNYERFLKETNL